MCLVCTDFVKGNLTQLQARINLREMEEVLSKDHFEETLKLIALGEPDKFEDQDYPDTDRMD